MYEFSDIGGSSTLTAKFVLSSPFPPLPRDLPVSRAAVSRPPNDIIELSLSGSRLRCCTDLRTALAAETELSFLIMALTFLNPSLEALQVIDRVDLVGGRDGGGWDRTVGGCNTNTETLVCAVDGAHINIVLQMSGETSSPQKQMHYLLRMRLPQLYMYKRLWVVSLLHRLYLTADRLIETEY